MQRWNLFICLKSWKQLLGSVSRSTSYPWKDSYTTPRPKRQSQKCGWCHTNIWIWGKLLLGVENNHKHRMVTRKPTSEAAWQPPSLLGSEMKEDARLSRVSQYKGWNGPDRWDGYLEKECSCSCPLNLALHGVQFLQDVFISSHHYRTLPEPASLLPKMQTGRILLASLSNSGDSLAGLNLIVSRFLNKMVPQEEIQAPKSPGSPRLCHIFIKKKKTAFR